MANGSWMSWLRQARACPPARPPACPRARARTHARTHAHARRYLAASHYAFSALVLAQFSGAAPACGRGMGAGLISSLQALLPETPQARRGRASVARKAACSLSMHACFQGPTASLVRLG
jgi:hypothetical protein